MRQLQGAAHGGQSSRRGEEIRTSVCLFLIVSSFHRFIVSISQSLSEGLSNPLTITKAPHFLNFKFFLRYFLLFDSLFLSPSCFPLNSPPKIQDPCPAVSHQPIISPFSPLSMIIVIITFFFVFYVFFPFSMFFPTYYILDYLYSYCTYELDLICRSILSLKNCIYQDIITLLSRYYHTIITLLSRYYHAILKLLSRYYHVIYFVCSKVRALQSFYDALSADPDRACYAYSHCHHANRQLAVDIL